MRPVFLTLFFGLFLLVGLAMLGAAGRSWWKSSQVEGWPVTDGEVIERDLGVDSDSDGTAYRAVVRYRYTVAGRSYESDRIAFGYAGSSGRDAHEAIHAALSRSDRIGVRYNPDDPAESALAYGLNRSTVMLMVFGIVWTFFTLGLATLFWLSGSRDVALVERLIVR